jgi:hypothetical protein
MIHLLRNIYQKIDRGPTSRVKKSGLVLSEVSDNMIGSLIKFNSAFAT